MNGEPDNKTYNTFIQSLGAALRADDKPPTDRKAWDERRRALRGHVRRDGAVSG